MSRDPGHIDRVVVRRSGRRIVRRSRVFRLTKEDMQREAASRGGEFLSPHYLYAPAKLRWRCAGGHVFLMTGAAVRQGSWCPACARCKFRLKDVAEAAAKQGGECLSTEYVPRPGTMRFRCGRGHEWEAFGDAVRAGRWCLACLRGPRPETWRRVCRIAKERGGRCLSEDRPTTRRLRFRCAKGHEWESKAGEILQGHWCGICAGRKLDLATLVEAARRRGGRCLETEYRNDVKLRFVCAKGHEWRTFGAYVSQGHWCPDCGHARPLTIEDMQKVAESRGGRCLSRVYRAEPYRLRWECGKGHRWQAVGLVVKSSSWCPACAGRGTLAQVQEAARKKGGECLSSRYRSGSSQMQFRCARGHAFELTGARARRGAWCPRCAPNQPLHIDDLRAIARARGGDCLSTANPGGKQKLEWQCAKGHLWDAPGAPVKAGAWCATCAGRKPATLSALRKIAAGRGGECLSSEYHPYPAKLRFRCAEGHVWETHARAVRRGLWCPDCAGNKKISEEQIRARARERGGEVVSTGRGLAEKWEWRCVHGHRWEALPKWIARGAWCPSCARSPTLLLGELRVIARSRGGECESEELNRKQIPRFTCRRGHVFSLAVLAVRRGGWCSHCS